MSLARYTVYSRGLCYGSDLIFIVDGILDKTESTLFLVFGKKQFLLHGFVYFYRLTTRLSRNLSHEKLAELGNFERSYISKVENAERSVQFKTVVRFAKALGIKPSDLVKKVEKHIDNS